MKEVLMDADIKKIIKEGWLQATITIGTVVITLINFWLAAKLAPLAQDIVTVATRVRALEEKNEADKQLVERFIVVEQQSKDILKNIERIDLNQQRMDNKLDRIIERYSLPANNQ